MAGTEILDRFFFMGRHLAFPESRLFRTESAYIETFPLKYVIMGGEKTTRTPMRLGIDPAAVKIMAPDSFQDHDEKIIFSPVFPCPVPL